MYFIYVNIYCKLFNFRLNALCENGNLISQNRHQGNRWNVVVRPDELLVKCTNCWQVN